MAAVPSPSAYPPTPPASVVTAMVKTEMERIRPLVKSDTYSLFPALSAATATGLLNLAALPTPSANPMNLPASVVTVMVETKMTRIRLLDRSAT